MLLVNILLNDEYNMTNMTDLSTQCHETILFMGMKTSNHQDKSFNRSIFDEITQIVMTYKTR